MRKKLLSLLLLSVLSINANALDIPKKSRFDSRMQHINYNLIDVTEIRAKDGYASVLTFSDDEKVLDIAVGFPLGWDIKDNDNNVYIRPIAVKAGEALIDPIIKEWDTNLLIRTNKFQYAFDLVLVDTKEKSNSYFVKFTYPNEEARQRAENKARLEKIRVEQREKENAEKEEKAVNKVLNNFTTPKNWDYAMKVGKDSREIIPSFTYDDGVRTYIGFNNVASIPAVFYYQGEQEMISNINTKQQGKYTVIVVHKTAPRFILRSGDQVVGIINNGFGKNPNSQISTTTSDVIRAVK